MGSQNNKNFSDDKFFSFSEVISDNNVEYAFSQLKKELPKKPLRNGAQIRITALKSLCELCEIQNKRLSNIENLLLEIKIKLKNSNGQKGAK